MRRDLHIIQINRAWSYTRRFFESPTKTFLMFAIIFGSLFILLAPPFTGADEEAHFIRAYGITNGVLILGDTVEVEVPKSFRETIGCFQTKKPIPGNVYRYNFENYGVNKEEAFSCAASLPLDENSVENVVTTAPGYSPTTYIPQTLTIITARLLDLPIVVMVYLNRFAVMAAYIVMIYIAIRLIPVRKWALAGIALLPHSLSHFTNPGGDYMLLGTVAIFAAVIIRSIYLNNTKLDQENRRLLIALGITMFFMVLPKGAFPGICFLPLIIFYGGFSYQKAKKYSLALFIFVIAILWQKLGVSAAMSSAGSITSSLIDFPYALLKTFFVRWVNRDFIFIGDNIGNIPLPNVDRLGMPSIIISIMNVLLAVYLFAGYKEKLKVLISKSQLTWLKISSIIIAIAVISGTFFALLTVGQYLQDGSLSIRGVQPRYFYPAFFMLATIPFIRNFSTQNTASYARVVITGTVLVLSTRVALLASQYHWGTF